LKKKGKRAKEVVLSTNVWMNNRGKNNTELLDYSKTFNSIGFKKSTTIMAEKEQS
jgi:hypothetical protein